MEWLDHQEGVPQDLEPKKMKLKGNGVHLRTRSDLTTILWCDKLDIYMFDKFLHCSSRM